MDNQVKKKRFLNEFLRISLKNGWSLATFEKTKKKLKYNQLIIDKIFPKKLDDLILFFNYLTNTKVSSIYKKKKFNKKSIRISVLNAVKIRFEVLNENKEAIKKSIIFLSKPSKQILSSKLIYKTVDHVWKLIGDKSTDYNFYTKRAILASIYSFALLIWINDKSDDLNKTFNFLEKSIMNMNIITNIKKKLKETIAQRL
tara:strand:- start:187 stop:786 length:600 start_codon:yes stop_codon:yes gene_type:complete